MSNRIYSLPTAHDGHRLGITKDGQVIVLPNGHLQLVGFVCSCGATGGRIDLLASDFEWPAGRN